MVALFLGDVELFAPDSSSYIHFSPGRTSGYPSFLKTFSKLGLSFEQITVVQLLFFCIAFSFLLYRMLRVGIPLFLTISFFLLMLGNFYFSQFHHRILSESITFSLIMLLIAQFLLLIQTRKLRYLIQCTTLVALSFIIRPAMIPFCVGVLISSILLRFSICDWRSILRYLLLGFVVPMLSIIILENLIYFSYHKQRQSLMPLLLKGKTAVITTIDGFDINRYPTSYQPLMERLMNQYSKLALWLNTVPGFFIKSNYYAVIESDAQSTEYYDSTHLMLLEGFAKKNQMTINDVKITFGLLSIKTHPWQYLKQALYHYVSIVTVLPKEKLEQLDTKPPLSPNMAMHYRRLEGGFKSNSATQKMMEYSFSIMAILFFGFSLLYGLWLLLSRFYFLPRLSFLEKLALNLLLWVHGYHFFIGLTNLALMRFLMPSYPLIILAILATTFSLLERVYKSHFQNVYFKDQGVTHGLKGRGFSIKSSNWS